MTLADFARSIGISPATARQWKRRGKIVERDGSLELLADVQKRDSLIGAEVCGGSGVTGKVIAATRDGFTVQCDSGASVTGAAPEHAKGIRVLTLERPSDTPEQEALRTAENLAGLPPSLPLPGLVDVTLPPLAEGQSHWTVTPAPSPDSAQDSRSCKRDNEAGTNRSESHREPCAGCEALQERVTVLEKVPTEDAGNKRIEDLTRFEVLERDNRILSDAVDSLRDLTTDQGRMLSEAMRRIEALEGDPTLRSLAQLHRADAELQRSIEALGKPKNGVIDPPSQGWGA